MPSPYFRPATSTAPQSSTPWLLIVVIAAAAYVLPSLRFQPDGVPVAPPAGINLVAAFKTNDNRAEAKAHAHQFATICASVAEYLEYDGTRSGEPLIKTGVQIDELRRGLRQTRTKGFSFLTKYPALHDELEKFLTAQVGTSGGPFDQAQRTKWVAAMRMIAAAAEYAAQRG